MFTKSVKRQIFEKNLKRKIEKKYNSKALIKPRRQVDTSQNFPLFVQILN
jgi:excinuclease UvrABC helicase subunit UvrB